MVFSVVCIVYYIIQISNKFSIYSCIYLPFRNINYSLNNNEIFAFRFILVVRLSNTAFSATLRWHTLLHKI